MLAEELLELKIDLHQERIFSCLKRWLYVFSQYMDIDNLSEKELLNTCILGNKEAWDAFVEKYTNLIYHTINKTLKAYSADHLYQEVSDIHSNDQKDTLK